MMKTRAFWIVLLVVVCAGATNGPSHATGRDLVQEASTFIQSLDDKAMEIVADQGLKLEDRQRSFRDMFVASFDVPAIGRFVLGRYWRAATDAQKTEFLALYEDMIVKSYSNRFSTFKGELFTITGSRADGESAMVASVIAQPNGSPVKVDWRVLKTEGRLKVVDVMVEGVSMSVMQQQEFGAVIQRGVGHIDSLITTMRDRAQEQQSRAARN